jgi:hypothetical protein
VVDVVYRLREQNRHVLIVQLVNRKPTLAHAAHQAEVTQEPKLVRDKRLLKAHTDRQSTHRTRPIAETRQEAHATRGSQRLHGLGNSLRGGFINPSQRHPTIGAMTHATPPIC